MWGASTAPALAARFAQLIEELGGDVAAAKTISQQRDLLTAIERAEPATLNQVAAAVKRGAPTVSRAVDALVRSGHVERRADPENRRRLALRLTETGRVAAATPPAAEHGLEKRLSKLIASELRALERGIEILERLPR